MHLLLVLVSFPFLPPLLPRGVWPRNKFHQPPAKRPRMEEMGKKPSAPNEGRSAPAPAKKLLACFACGGPHLMKNCPKRERITTVVAEEEDDHIALNPMVLNVITAASSSQPATSCSYQSATPPMSSKLLYVAVKLNGQLAQAMLDIGPSHFLWPSGQQSALACVCLLHRISLRRSM